MEMIFVLDALGETDPSPSLSVVTAISSVSSCCRRILGADCRSATAGLQIAKCFRFRVMIRAVNLSASIPISLVLLCVLHK